MADWTSREFGYSNNINVPTNESAKPTISITLSGNFTGTLEKTFEILPKEIKEGLFFVVDQTEDLQDTMTSIYLTSS